MKRNSRPRTQKYWFSLLLTTIFGCGVEVGNPEKPGTTPVKSIITQDLAVATEIISGQIDEMISAVSDSYAGDDEMALFLTSSNRTFDCKPGEDGKVIVSLKSNGNANRHVNRRQKNIRVESSGKVESIAIFNAADSGLVCNKSKTKLKLKWRDIKDLNLEIKTTKVSTSRLTDTASEKVVRDIATESSGNRMIRRHQLPADFPGSHIKTTINQSFIKKTKVKNSDDDLITLVSTTTALNGEPLEIHEKYSIENQLIEKTVDKGGMVSVFEDGAKIEISYSGVVFSPLAGCRPLAGSVSGKIYNSAKDLEPLRAFNLSFTAFENTVNQLEFDNGEKSNVEFDICHYEEK